MPELRRDPLTGESVLIAASRAGRPGAFRRGRSSASSATKNGDQVSAGSHDPECPFCPGNEYRTPPEVARTPPGDPDGPGWSVRVFPNLYPLVGSDVDSNTSTGERSVTGVHEVIVLSPVHDRSFGRLDDAQAADVFSVARSRAAAHASAGARHVQVFVNYGADAGASLFHSHAQLVAMDRVPDGVAADVGRVGASGPETSRHDPVAVACDEADGPRGLGRHGLDESDAVAIWCPHASVRPYQVRLALPDAGAVFGAATDSQVRSMASALRSTLARIGTLLDDPPYNVIVRSAPVGERDFHWYVDVLPRLTVLAGFEIATDLSVNVVDPETAATDLRGAGGR